MQHNVKFGIAIWQKKKKATFLPVKVPTSQLHTNLGLYSTHTPHPPWMRLLNDTASGISCPGVVIWRKPTQTCREHSTDSKGKLLTETIGLCTWNVVGHLLAPLAHNCCSHWPRGSTHSIRLEPECEIGCSLRCLNLEFVSSVTLPFEFFGGFFVVLEWLSLDCCWYSWIMSPVWDTDNQQPHTLAFFPNSLSS